MKKVFCISCNSGKCQYNYIWRNSPFLAQEKTKMGKIKGFFAEKKKSENISIQGHSYLNKSQPASHSRLYLYFEPGNICLIVGGHVTVS